MKQNFIYKVYPPSCVVTNVAVLRILGILFALARCRVFQTGSGLFSIMLLFYYIFVGPDFQRHSQPNYIILPRIRDCRVPL
jgi:hypothetical protein